MASKKSKKAKARTKAKIDAQVKSQNAAAQGSKKSESPQAPAKTAAAPKKAEKKPAKAAAQKTTSPQAKRGKRRVAIIVGAVVVVIAAVAIGVFAFMNTGKSNLLQPKGYDTSGLKVYEKAESSDGGRTVTYNGATYKLNEDIVPICIMGQDKGLHKPDEGTNGQADAIMVLAVDTKTNDIKGVAIPRDSMVKSLKKFRDAYKNTSYKTDKMQLCLAFACGDNDDESSKNVMAGASSILYGIPINYYYTLDTGGLGELATLAGGVTLQALYTIPQTYYASTIPIEAGKEVTLAGNDALRYVQYRDTSRYETALERLDRQQQFIKELGKKLLKEVKQNPGLVGEIVNTLQQYSTTNIGTAEFSYLATVAANTSVDTVDLTRLKGEAVHNADNPWEQYILDEEAVYQVVLDTFYNKVS